MFHAAPPVDLQAELDEKQCVLSLSWSAAAAAPSPAISSFTVEVGAADAKDQAPASYQQVSDRSKRTGLARARALRALSIFFLDSHSVSPPTPCSVFPNAHTLSAYFAPCSRISFALALAFAWFNICCSVAGVRRAGAAGEVERCSAASRQDQCVSRARQRCRGQLCVECDLALHCQR